MAAKSPFPGFSKRMPAFFRGLSRNNTREWFAPRKAAFEQDVRGPMVELVSLVNEDLRRFAAEHALEQPARAIYRIYRDTRFSKDKTPYKTHIGATFARRGLAKHGGAGFYFGVSHEHVEVAGGIYMPGPDEIPAVRRAIVAAPRAFLKLVTDAKLVRRVGPLVGERLTRPPKGFEGAPTEVAEYVRFKQWYFYVTLDPKLALTPRIRKEVVGRFELMAEALAWINAAVLAGRAGDGEDEKPVRPEPMW
jgi:uncharacterized protein (TIGR02453 family)